MNYEIRIDLYETKYCYLDNKLHREDGPAIEHPAGQNCGIKMENFIGKMVRLSSILVEKNDGI